MFLTTRARKPDLLEFGIDIPLNRSRYEHVLNWVQRNTQDKLILCDGPDSHYLSYLDHVHDKNYIQALLKHPESFIKDAYELHQSKRYRPEVATRSFNELFQMHLAQAYVTYLTMLQAIENEFAYHLGGGMHHALRERPNGFCLIHDIVIGLNKLLDEKRIKHAWIIDIDAHRGDGTAELTRADKRITTLSIHMQKGWPQSLTPKIHPEHFVPSNIDIEMASGEESQYCKKLQEALLQMQKNYPTPDLVLINAGSDPFELDSIESSAALRLDQEQMLKRDQIVFDFCRQNTYSQAYVMSGGYGPHSHIPYINFFNWLKEVYL